MTNGDEQNYRNFIGNFHKGLPHNDIGEVIPNAYRNLLNALSEGTAAALERRYARWQHQARELFGGPRIRRRRNDSAPIEDSPFPKLASLELPTRRSSCTGWRCAAM
jgi:hypothetical protein